MRLLKYMLVMMMLYLPFSVEANDVDSVDQVDTIMANVGNQFIYAFFGKDILLYYLADSDESDLIEATSNSELTLLAQPFNSQIGNYVRLGMNSIWMLTVGYFLFRLVAYGFEKSWVKQGQKSQQPNTHDYRGTIVKFIVFGALALTPITLKPFENSDAFSARVSIFTLPLFSILGQAHQHSDDSMAELILTQRQSLSTIAIPKSSAKWSSGTELNTFFTCLRLSENRADLTEHSAQLDIKINDGLAYGVLSEGECNLSVSFGFDVQSDTRIEDLKKMVPDLPLDSGLFKQAQKSVFKDILDSSLANALTYSSVLSLPSNGDLVSELSFEDIVMKKWTSVELNSSEIGKWENYCDEIKSFQYPYDKINPADRVLYNLLTARCASKDVVKQLLFPDTFGALDDFFASGALRDRNIPMCVDKVKLAEMSARGDRFMPVYASDSEVDVSDNIDSLSLESCVVQYCSESSLSSGGLYSCVNAMELYERRLKDHRVIERGSMMMGFYMFSLFTNQMPSQLSKHIFNRTEFLFSSEPFKQRGDDDELLFSSSVLIPAVQIGQEDNWSTVNEQIDTLDERGYYTKLITKDPTNINLLQNVFRLNRLMTCVRNPLQVVDGYVCGNIPQEFNAFGTNLIRLAIAGKTVLVVGNSLTHTRGDKKVGTVGARGASNIILRLSSYLGGSAVAQEVVSSYLDGGFAITDEFGFLSKSELKEYSSWSNLVYAITLLDMSSENSAVKVIENALLSMLVMGIMFGIVLPMFPFIIVVGAVANFVFLLVKVLFLTGFKLTDIVFEDDPEILSNRFDALWADWIGLFLKLPLTAIGVVLSWIMSNVIVSHVLKRMNLEMVFSGGSGSFLHGLLDSMLVIVFTFSVIYVVFNMILTIIDSFYDFCVDWMLGKMTESAYGDRKAFSMQNTRSVLSAMGR